MSLPRTSRRTFLKASGAGGLGLILAARQAPAVAEKRPPNLLFMHLDQHHWEAVSAFGCSHVRTPNIDRLAAQGTSFSLSYSANPVCCPARACWYTGRASSENGVVMNDQWPVAPEMPDLGQWLSGRGYDSVYAGKWHVTGRNFAQSFRVLTPGSGIGEVTDGAVARAAEGFLRSRPSGGKPFFLNLGFLQPHDCCYWVFEHSAGETLTRLGPPPDDLPPLPANHGHCDREPAPIARKREKRTGDAGWSAEHWRWYLWNYYRMVEMADAEVGRVLDALEDANLAQDTLVVLSADHGDGLGRHGLTSKMFLYDEAARVPFIAACPGRVQAGVRDTRHLVSGLDVAPTLCDLAGVEGLPKARGLSLRPLLEGRSDAPWREFLVSDTFRTGRMVRTPEYKYIAYAGDPATQLFDLRSDPGELKNLADDADKADTVRDLATRLAAWEKSLDIYPLKEPVPGAKRAGKRKKNTL
jgi:choline-sulfatase